MEKITIKAYAVRHKLSIFNVMKMVKSGKLKSMVEKVDTKELTYIVLDDDTEEEVKNGIIPFTREKESTLEEKLNDLSKEVKLLRMEIESIKKSV